MGQKTNPNIFRLGVNKTWKTEFFEKKNAELSLYTFKDLEIKDYIERFLEIHGLILHDYKQQYSNSTLNLYISYFVTSECNLLQEQPSTLFLVDQTGQKKKVSTRLQAKTQSSVSSNFAWDNTKTSVQDSYVLRNYLKRNNFKGNISELRLEESTQSNTIDGALQEMFTTLISQTILMKL